MADPQAADLLRRVWGFDAFRPGQQEIVEAVAAGRDVLAIMPTGGGKSLCYQLPALMRDGVTVVIGSEHNSTELRRFSVIVSTYSDGRGTGAVGVIGPTRMHYSRAINAVDSLTRMISRVVSDRT